MSFHDDDDTIDGVAAVDIGAAMTEEWSSASSSAEEESANRQKLARVKDTTSIHDDDDDDDANKDDTTWRDFPDDASDVRGDVVGLKSSHRHRRLRLLRERRSPFGTEVHRRRGRHSGLRSSRGGGGGGRRRGRVGGVDAAAAAAAAAASLPQNHARPNCSTKSCRIREEAKRIRLEVIKAQILQKLRLTHVPNITKTDVPRLPSPIEHLLDEYGATSGGSASSRSGVNEVDVDDDDNNDDFHAQTTKVIKFGEKPPADKTPASPDASKTIYFEFQPESLRAKVLHAQLYIYVEKPVGPARGQTILLVYKMPPLSSPSSQPVLVCDKAVELGSSSGRRWNHWQSCNIELTVEDWLHHADRNFGLKIELNDHRGNPLAVLHSDDKNDNRKPFIEVQTSPLGENRKKRTIGIDCDSGSTETRCCRYKLTVDFDSFGWDWIVAPKRYEAFFCAGECPFVFLQRYTHSHIIQQANPTGAGGPCCTPTKMSPVSLLYFDDRREIISGILPDMSVDKCGCS